MIDDIKPQNFDVELTFDNGDNNIPFTLRGLVVVELNDDGSSTAKQSSFHFTDTEVHLQNFEGPSEDQMVLTLDRHYWHAPLDELP